MTIPFTLGPFPVPPGTQSISILCHVAADLSIVSLIATPSSLNFPAGDNGPKSVTITALNTAGSPVPCVVVAGAVPPLASVSTAGNVASVTIVGNRPASDFAFDLNLTASAA